MQLLATFNPIKKKMFYLRRIISVIGSIQQNFDKEVIKIYNTNVINLIIIIKVN